jgi:SAM-dependent methyltransferase
MVEDAARRGYARGAGAYRAARPSYHPTIVDELVHRTAGIPVVELGAGTGILTAQLIARGLDVVAVEPVEAMRQALIQDIGEAKVRDGAAEDIPLATAAAGAVIAAQAFHWFDPGPTLDEISRVLRPDGQLLTVWNVRDETVPWVAAYTQVVDRYAGDTPRYRAMNWRRAIESDGRFVLEDERSTPNPQPVDAEQVVKRALSTSFIASLTDEEQATVVQQIREIVDGMGERFDYPYHSELQAWRRSS